MPKEEDEIRELERKWAQNPDSMVFVQLADAYRRSGDLERSVETCLKGLARHPTYATARIILGRGYFDLGKLDEAAAEFRRVEAVDADNILVHRMLGQIALRKGLTTEAISHQQRILALDPDDSAAQELLREALLRAKQPESAAPVAKPAAPAPTMEAAATQPAGHSAGNHDKALKVADIYAKKKAWDQADEVLTEILALSPGFVPALERRRSIAEQRSSDEAKRKADEEAKHKADEEAKRKAEEAQRKAVEEAKRKADEEAKRRADEEARRKAEEEAKRKADEEAKRRADEEAKRRADEEAKRRADEEAKRRADEEAKRRADEEAKRKADEEAKRRANEEALRKATEEAKRKVDEDAHRKAEEEAKRKAAAAEVEAKRKADAEKLSAKDILATLSGSGEELMDDEPSRAVGSPSTLAPVKDATGVKSALRELAESVEGVLAAGLVGMDGLVMDRVSLRNGFDLAAVGAGYAGLLKGALKASRDSGLGRALELVVTSEKAVVLLAPAGESAFLVLVLALDGNLGRGRLELKRRAVQLGQAFA